MDELAAKGNNGALILVYNIKWCPNDIKVTYMYMTVDIQIRKIII